MKPQDMIAIWTARKTGRGFYRLKSPYTAEYEFKKLTNHGHYAYVRFCCTPSEEFVFTAAPDLWPTNLSADYRDLLKGAMVEAVVDTLWCSSMRPPYGCTLALEAIRWDDIDGNENAFYQATAEAMKRLISKADWK